MQKPLKDAFSRLILPGMFQPQIEALRNAVFTKILPALADAEAEAEQILSERWEEVMRQPSDGNFDPGSLAELVKDHAIAEYKLLIGVQQASMNMVAVMLWHLIEQQMLWYLRHDVLTLGEQDKIKRCGKTFRQLCRLWELQRRFTEWEKPLEALACWPKLDELRLVANTVKHAAGDSATQLYALRPDLFKRKDLVIESPLAERDPHSVLLPAAGEDIFVTQDELAQYFDAAQAFWREFFEYTRDICAG